MMEDFKPSDSLLMKYENSIANCEKALRGKRVLDMGCNNGIYSYMAMRHGASHVVGIEPRGMFVSGLNAFAEQHDLPMEFHRGYDTDMARLIREHDIDTVIMMSVDGITNWENMMYDVRKSDAEWLIMQATSIPDTWIDFNKTSLITPSPEMACRWGSPYTTRHTTVAHVQASIRCTGITPILTQVSNT